MTCPLLLASLTNLRGRESFREHTSRCPSVVRPAPQFAWRAGDAAPRWERKFKGVGSLIRARIELHAGKREL